MTTITFPDAKNHISFRDRQQGKYLCAYHVIKIILNFDNTQLKGYVDGIALTNVNNMKNILVPCDFSKPAVNAFRFAIDMAMRSKGVIYLLNVVELPAIHDPIIMPVVAFEKDFMKELKQ